MSFFISFSSRELSANCSLSFAVSLFIFFSRKLVIIFRRQLSRIPGIGGTSYLIPTPPFSVTLFVTVKAEFHFISSILFRFPPFTSQHHSSSDLPINPFASFSSSSSLGAALFPYTVTRGPSCSISFSPRNPILPLFLASF